MSDTQPRTFILKDHFPGRLLSLNAAYRMPWYERHALEAAWRDAIFWLTKAKRPAMFTTKVRIAVTFVVKDPEQRRDSHNFVATTKPMVDGLCLAGLIADDSTEHVVNDDIRFVGPTDTIPANTFIITITEEPS